MIKNQNYKKIYDFDKEKWVLKEKYQRKDKKTTEVGIARPEKNLKTELWFFYKERGNNG